MIFVPRSAYVTSRPRAFNSRQSFQETPSAGALGLPHIGYGARRCTTYRRGEVTDAVTRGEESREGDLVSSAVRATEWKSVVALLANLAAGPVGLFVEGEAGIGKTTLYRDAIEFAHAEGFQVLAAHGSPGEVNFAFAALADLLADVDVDVFADLPSVQRAALDQLLLRGSAAPVVPDERASAAALYSVVQRLEERAPVLIAIDDVPTDATSGCRPPDANGSAGPPRCGRVDGPPTGTGLHARPVAAHLRDIRG
jgi:hypothetical protein